MNVYEEAHNLASAIKESNEYKDYDVKRKVMEGDKEGKKMLEEFQLLQIQMQTRQLAGEDPDENLMQRVQQLYSLILTKPQAADYLQAEARFSIMMKDVYEILSEVMNIGFMNK